MDLVTSDNIIDREHAEILSEGGLYQFQVILASDWSNIVTKPEYWPLIGPDKSSDLIGHHCFQIVAKEVIEPGQYGEETRTSVTLVVRILASYWSILIM